MNGQEQKPQRIYNYNQEQLPEDNNEELQESGRKEEYPAKTRVGKNQQQETEKQQTQEK